MSAKKGNDTLKMICLVDQHLRPYLKDAEKPYAEEEELPEFPKVQGGKQLPPTKVFLVSEDGVLDLQGHIPRRYEEAHHLSLREYHKQNIDWERVKVLKLKYSSLFETGTWTLPRSTAC